jgi:hypothetical protein
MYFQMSFDSGGDMNSAMSPVYAVWAQGVAPWIGLSTILALLLVPVGLILMMWAGRRRFSRTNAHGVEQFASYGQSLSHRAIEELVSLLGRLAFSTGLFSGFFACWAIWMQQY